MDIYPTTEYISYHQIHCIYPTTRYISYHRIYILPPDIYPTTRYISYHQIYILLPDIYPTTGYISYHRIYILPPDIYPTTRYISYHRIYILPPDHHDKAGGASVKASPSPTPEHSKFCLPFTMKYVIYIYLGTHSTQAAKILHLTPIIAKYQCFPSAFTARHQFAVSQPSPSAVIP